MTPADLPKVLLIEARSFRTPWPPESFLSELQAVAAWCRVAVHAQRGVVGYLVCRLLVDVWHVLDVAVAPEVRNRGVARALLTEFLAATAPTGCEVTLEVRPSNEPAIRLYEELGFVACGRRRGYYTDTQEDALIMTLTRTGRRTM